MNEQLDDLPKLDPHWNYRVIRRTWEIGGETEEQFGIYEVYYSDGKPVMCSEMPDGAIAESPEGLKEVLEWQRVALEKPVLNYEDFGSEESDTETIA